MSDRARPTLPPEVTAAMKETGLNLNVGLAAQAVTKMLHNFAVSLKENNRWLQFPENPDTAYQTLINPELTQPLDERNAGYRRISAYVTDGDSPTTIEDHSKSPWHKVVYSLSHHLLTEWRDDDSVLNAKLVMHPQFPKDQEPEYRFGHYAEYKRSDDGLITEVVYTPVYNDGKTGYLNPGWEAKPFTDRQVVSLENTTLQGRQVIIEKARHLNVENIKDLSDQAIKDSKNNELLEHGTLFISKNDQIKPVVSEDGYIEVPNSEEINVYFMKQGMCVIDADWVRGKLQAAGIDYKTLKSFKSESGLTSYLILPLAV